MADLDVLCVFAFSEQAMATYTNDQQEEFEVVYSRTYSDDPPINDAKIIKVSRAGHDIPKTDGIWKEIRNLLLGGG